MKGLDLSSLTNFDKERKYSFNLFLCLSEASNTAAKKSELRMASKNLKGVKLFPKTFSNHGFGIACQSLFLFDSREINIHIIG